MTNLSPTQEKILKLAAKHPKQDVRESMTQIKNRAVYEKVLNAMLKNGLVAEGDEDGGLIYLITDLGMSAVGKKVAEAKSKPAAKPAKAKTPKAKAPAAEGDDKTNKKATIIAMLKRKEGATLDQLMTATKWQRHSVHGFISNLRRKDKMKIDQTKESGKDAVYRAA